MLNRIVIMGRLAKTPELRSTGSGTAVTSVTLAVDRDTKNQNGSYDTDWIDVVAWKGTAEFLSRYFIKGSTAIVEGRLQMREWTDKDGNKRKSAEVIADHVYFGGSKSEGGQKTAPTFATEQPMQGFAEIKEEDGDLPF
jgi:single-strand DNA-binding protein